MDNYSTVIDNANFKFKSEYKSALLIAVPAVIAGIINYLMATFLFSGESLSFQIITFFVGSITSFATYKLAVTVVRDDILSIEELFSPITLLVQFILYSVLIFAITSILSLALGKISLDLLFELIEPFFGFIDGAKSSFGITIRIIIAMDIIIIPIFLVTFLVVHKFFMTPFYIVNRENVIEALRESYTRTTCSTLFILKVFTNLLVKFVIFFNIYLIFYVLSITNGNLTISTAFVYNVILYAFLFAYFIPYSYIVMGTLFDDLY